MAVSKDDFRRTLGHFATGVTVITVARDETRVHGMTANAFASVSLEPLLVLVCISHSARTHALVQARRRFGVNVLAEDQRRLAEYFTSPEQDEESAKRLGVSYRRTVLDTPRLEGCLAWLECRLAASHEAGDHTIFVGEVEDVMVRDGRPLLRYLGRYCRLDSEAP